MPDPRTIALEKNDRSKFQEDLESTYDGMGGVPRNSVPDRNLEVDNYQPDQDKKGS